MSGSDYEDKVQESAGHGESLARQITMSISPEQYERLFFQPTPARGDLSKRLGILPFLAHLELQRRLTRPPF